MHRAFRPCKGLDRTARGGYWLSMPVDYKLVGQALGLAALLEGLLYFCLAERMPAVLRRLAESPPAALRLAGAVAMALGLGLLHLLK